MPDAPALTPAAAGNVLLLSLPAPAFLGAPEGLLLPFRNLEWRAPELGSPGCAFLLFGMGSWGPLPLFLFVTE